LLSVPSSAQRFKIQTAFAAAASSTAAAAVAVTAVTAAAATAFFAAEQAVRRHAGVGLQQRIKFVPDVSQHRAQLSFLFCRKQNVYIAI
jgi:hypothetical protein